MSPSPVAVILRLVVASAAAVVGLSVRVEVVLPSAVEVYEPVVHVAVMPVGRPLTASETAPEKAPPVVVNCRVPDAPWAISTLVALSAMVKVGVPRIVTGTDVVAVVLPLTPVMVMFDVPGVAVPATVSVTVELAPGFTLTGLKLSVTPAGVVALRLTVPVNPPVAVTAKVKIAVLPCSTDSDADDAFKVNPAWGAETVPELDQPFTSRFASTEPRPVARL